MPPRTDAVISEERFHRYHAYARRRGVNWPLYLLARMILQPAFRIWLRLSRVGREHLRGVEGGLIVASNHRSFLDPFVIATTLPWRRPMQYVAKVELFESRWRGWILSRVGAFPIRRGQSDETAMETARLVLDRGGTVCIFPEGTRIRSGSLGTPKRGVGRLALETGAAVVPVAVHGSEQVRRGWRIRPRKVRLRVGRPVTFPHTEHPSPALAATVTARIWPNVELQWEWLGGLPPLRKAAVIGAGSWGTAMAVLLARGGLEVQLGTRTQEKAAEIAAKRLNARYLPGVRLPESVAVKRAGEIELAGVDLVCLAVPSAALPAAVGSLADRIGSRAAVLMLTKGLVQPLGQLPSDYVSERIRSRSIASLGGPAHAREAAAGMAALVLGSSDQDLRAQLGEVFDRAGLVCERSEDVVGVEMAGVAKNAAALGAAAAEAHGLNAAGIAAATIWRECVEYALAQRSAARHLHRACRRRGPDRDRARAREPQPPRWRAARRRRRGGPDSGPDRSGVRGARLGAAASGGGGPGGHRGAGPGRAFRPDRGSHRPGRVGGRTAARRANPSCGIGNGRTTLDR